MSGCMGVMNKFVPHRNVGCWLKKRIDARETLRHIAHFADRGEVMSYSSVREVAMQPWKRNMWCGITQLAMTQNWQWHAIQHWLPRSLFQIHANCHLHASAPRRTLSTSHLLQPNCHRCIQSSRRMDWWSKGLNVRSPKSVECRMYVKGKERQCD